MAADELTWSWGSFSFSSITACSSCHLTTAGEEEQPSPNKPCSQPVNLQKIETALQ